MLFLKPRKTWKILGLLSLSFFLSCGNKDLQEPINFAFIEGYGGGKANRYLIKNVDINEQGNQIRISGGRTITVRADIFHDCPECGASQNQIIVGLSGDDKAQACIWSGNQGNRNWETVEFKLKVPNQSGTFYIRSRYAQAANCKDALNWWKVDRPRGPDHKSNIAAIRVN